MFRAIADSTNSITSSLDKQWIYLLISKKMSDIVHHGILLKKLDFYCIRGVSGDFLKS